MPNPIIEDPERLVHECPDEVLRALSRLRTIERSCLLLLSLGGYSYSEIAEVVGIPVASVTTHGDELEEFERELGEDERQAIVAEKRLDTCIIETIKQAAETCPEPLWDRVASDLQGRISYWDRLALSLPWLGWKPGLGLAGAVALVIVGIFFGNVQKNARGLSRRKT